MAQIIPMEDEFKTNQEAVKRLCDPFIFGNLKTETHTFVMDARKTKHKKETLQQANGIVNQSKIIEQSERLLYEEISKDTRKDIIESSPEIQEQQRVLDELIRNRQRLVKEKEQLQWEMDCSIYNYNKQKEIYQQIKLKNLITSKIISMKGNLESGVLICNKEIIPFNVEGMKREEKQQYLCDLILNYDFN